MDDAKWADISNKQNFVCFLVLKDILNSKSTWKQPILPL